MSLYNTKEFIRFAEEHRPEWGRGEETIEEKIRETVSTLEMMGFSVQGFLPVPEDVDYVRLFEPAFGQFDMLFLNTPEDKEFRASVVQDWMEIRPYVVVMFNEWKLRGKTRYMDIDAYMETKLPFSFRPSVDTHDRHMPAVKFAYHMLYSALSAVGVKIYSGTKNMPDFIMITNPDHAVFEYTVDDVEKVIRVIDTGYMEHRSVTNDAENVIAKLHEEIGDLSGYEVLYRDSTGQWDGMKVIDNQFAGFYPGHMGGSNEQEG